MKSTPNDVTLSERQIQVLRLMMAAHPDKEIAARLSMSPATVAGHIRTCCHAIGLSTRMELARWAMQHPEALRGEPASRAMHDATAGCLCPYCVALS